MQTTRCFYPGSFDLKLLQSTRQGDFASLQRGLNPLISKDYNNYFNNCQSLLEYNHNSVNLKELFYNMIEQNVLLFSNKTVYHNCDKLHRLSLEWRMDLLELNMRGLEIFSKLLCAYVRASFCKQTCLYRQGKDVVHKASLMLITHFPFVEDLVWRKPLALILSWIISNGSESSILNC